MANFVRLQQLFGAAYQSLRAAAATFQLSPCSCQPLAQGYLLSLCGQLCPGLQHLQQSYSELNSVLLVLMWHCRLTCVLVPRQYHAQAWLPLHNRYQSQARLV